MKPSGGGEPTGPLADAIARDFNSFAKFKEEFTAAAVSQFGSGWAWLVVKDGKLAVTKTSNADLPMKHGQTALLTCDVWEHAYYPTHKNLRPKYVEVSLSSLVNWDRGKEPRRRSLTPSANIKSAVLTPGIIGQANPPLKSI